MNRSSGIGILIAVLFHMTAVSQEPLKSHISNFIEENMDQYEALYVDLHQTPELSFREFKTSDKMAGQLQNLGFEVTRNVGGNSLVGVLRNGDGPVVLLRTDMDALPIIEKTGLPYASRIVYENENGEKVGAMHACGHDIHMSVWVGTAQALLKFKDHWHGTLVMIAQQAEEQSGGANKMIESGIFHKFPVPDYALALHVDPELRSGTVGYSNGPSFAGVNSVDIRVFGSGGHGAYPHRTIDPVVIASRIVLDLQTIVSREISPLQPAVVTVGSIHGGTQHNIIPDEVDLQLTIRFYDDQVYGQIIDAIKRITSGIAASAGLPEDKYPQVAVTDQYTPPVINDKELTRQVISVMEKTLGPENVIEQDPLMAGEDFGKYGRTPEDIPIMMFMLGSVDPEKHEGHEKQGSPLPGLHSPMYAPDFRGAIKTGILVMSASVIDLMNP
jgi:hippurate hydrolase